MLGEVSAEEPGPESRVHHLFDPWLTCSHPLADALTKNIASAWRHIEPPRQRRPREADIKNRDDILAALIANLTYAKANGFEPPTVGISLRAGKRKATRYDREGFTAVPRIATLLQNGGGDFVILRKSKRYGVASTIEFAPPMARELARFRFNGDDFSQLDAGRETVWLSRTERDQGRIIGRELVDYSDTEETTRLRKEVVRINSALARADLRLLDETGRPTTTGLRSLRRVFNLPPGAPAGTERFDHGGRLFGAWWQPLEKERRPSIRIDGEPIADLDFSNLFLRLAYLQAGLEPPSGDLYATIPALAEPRWRAGTKKVVSAMLFRDSPLTRAPRETRDMLPPGLSGAEMRAAILAAFPTLAGVFETGAGLRLMHVESRILIAALLALADAGVSALPMHDGLMVARSKGEAAREAMAGAADRIVGFPLPITLTTL